MELYNGRPEDEAGREPKEIRVYDMLDQLHIPFQRTDHEAANTMEACNEIDEVLDVLICKNLFLCNRKKTKSSKEPISDFCKLCRENSFALYEMELITFGEAEYAAMKRSTNGGGENSPMMDGQDDIYEMLLLELEALK